MKTPLSLLIICFSLSFSCQSIYEADRIDPINPYGIYNTEQNQPSVMHDARKSSPAPESLASYSYKPMRSSSGKISKTSVSITKNSPNADSENSPEE